MIKLTNYGAISGTIEVFNAFAYNSPFLPEELCQKIKILEIGNYLLESNLCELHLWNNYDQGR